MKIWFELDKKTQLTLLAAALVLSEATSGCGGGGGGGSSTSQTVAALGSFESSVYSEVESCTGFTAPPPEIRFVDPVPCPSNGGHLCCMGSGDRSGEYDGTVVLPDPSRTESYCSWYGLRDEFLHHILCENGVSCAEDAVEKTYEAGCVTPFLPVSPVSS